MPDGMADPFICKEPPFVQPTPEGRAFFVWGKDSNDAIANVPGTFEDGTAAVPGEAVHSWDHDASTLVQDWVDPQLVMGLYNGKYCVYALKRLFVIHLSRNLFISYIYANLFFLLFLIFSSRRNLVLGADGE